MPVFEIKLDDGRIVDWESETEPTREEVLAEVARQESAQAEPPRLQPETGERPLTEEWFKEFQQSFPPSYQPPIHGAGQFAPGGPDWGPVPGVISGVQQNLPGLISELPGAFAGLGGLGFKRSQLPILATAANAVGSVLEGAMQPAEDIGAEVLSSWGMPWQPGATLLPELMPSEEAKGFIPALKRNVVGLATPGFALTVPLASAKGLRLASRAMGTVPLSSTEAALGSKAIVGGFHAGALSTIPASVEQAVNAESWDEFGEAMGNLTAGLGFAYLTRKPVWGEKKPALPKWYPKLKEYKAKELRKAVDDILGIERSYLESEIAPEDVSVRGRPVKFQVYETAPQQPGNSPFTIDPKSGSVVIIADRLPMWKAILAKKGVDLKQAVVSAIDEEILHLAISEAGRKTKTQIRKYWDGLSGLEREIARRRYSMSLLRFPKGYDEMYFAEEAVRFRIQQAAGMTPSEFTLMSRTQRWTWKSLTGLETAIRYLREEFTKEGAANRNLFDKALANINAAKQDLFPTTEPTAKPIGKVEAPAPAATEPTAKVEPPAAAATAAKPPEKTAAEIAAEERAKKLTPQAATAFAENYVFNVASQILSDIKEPKLRRRIRKAKADLFDYFLPEFAMEFGYAPPEQLRTVFLEGAGEALIRLARENPESLLELAKSTNVIKNILGGGVKASTLARLQPLLPPGELPSETGGVFAPAKKKIRGNLKRLLARNKLIQENKAKYDKLLEQARGIREELRKAGYAGVTRSGRLVPRTLKPGETRVAEGTAQNYADALNRIRGEMDKLIIESTEPDVRRRLVALEKERPKSKAEREAETEAEAEAKAEEEGKTEAELETERETALADEENWAETLIAKQLRALSESEWKGLEEEWYDVTLFPTRPSTRMKPTLLEQQQNTLRVAQELFSHLVEKSFNPRKSVARKTIYPDDVGNQQNAKQPVYYKVSPDELKDPEALAQKLTEDAGVSGKTQSITHRLVVFQNKNTKAVTVLSIYRRAARGGEPAHVRVSPLSETGGELSFPTMMKSHRPIYSIYLEDPVQHFRKHYKTLLEYENDFGQDAEWRSRSVEPSFLGAGLESALFEQQWTTGERAPRGEFVPGRGEIWSGGMFTGTFADVARAEMGMGGRRKVGAFGGVADADVAKLFEAVPEFKDPLWVFGFVDKVKANANLPITQQPIQALAALARMIEITMRRDKKLSPRSALIEVAKQIYDLHRNSPDRATTVARTVEHFSRGPAEPTGAAGAKAAAERRAAEFIEQQRVERLAAIALERGQSKPAAPAGYGRRLITALDRFEAYLAASTKEPPAKPEAVPVPTTIKQRAPIPNVSLALKIGMAGEAYVRAKEAKAAAQVTRDFIKQQRVEYDRFTKHVKDLGKIQQEIDAEIAREKAEGALKVSAEEYAKYTTEYAGYLAKSYPKYVSRGEMGEHPSGPSPRVKELFNHAQQYSALIARQMTSNPYAALADWYSGWMIDNVRRAGKKNASRAADIFDVINDKVKKYYDNLATQKGVNDALVASAGTKMVPLLQQVPTPGRMAATLWLQKVDHPYSKHTGVARMFPLLNKRIPDRKIPRYARYTARVFGEANLNVGKEYEPVTQGFKATGRPERIWTPFGYDFFSAQTGPIWHAYVDDFARANPDPKAKGTDKEKFKARVKQIKRDYYKLRKELNKPVHDINAIETIRQDMTIKYPNPISHVRTPFGYQEILHATLFNYIQNTALHAAHIRAFRESFPNTKAGKADFGKMDWAVRRELIGKPGPLNDWDNLIKTSQGRPTDTYNKDKNSPFQRVKDVVGPPGSAPRELVRAINSTVISLARRGVLTGQMVTQLPETVVGPALQFFGPRNYMISLMRMGELWAQTEREGMVNKQLYDYSMDPASPIRSLFRMMGNTVSKAYAENFLNELQGRMIAANAITASQRFLAGVMTRHERRMFRETLINMQFPKERVKDLFKAQQMNNLQPHHAQFLEMFERRAPSWMVSEFKTMMEGSTLAANRLFNSYVRFQMYPMMKLNQLHSVWRRLFDWKEMSREEKVSAVERWFTFHLGTAAQGAFLTLFSAYMFGGKEGFKQQANRVTDEPLDFWIESLLGAIGGPYYLVFNGYRWGGMGGIGDAAARVIFPFSVMGELMQAATQTGRYKDMNFWESIGEFLLKHTPGFRIMKTQLGVWGVGNADRQIELEQDIRAFNAWSKERYGYTKVDRYVKEDLNRDFRTAMKNANEAMIEGDVEGYNKWLAEGFRDVPEKVPVPEITGMVRQKISTFKILTTPSGGKLEPEDEHDLIDRIGVEAYRRLELFDAMVEAAALDLSQEGSGEAEAAEP